MTSNTIFAIPSAMSSFVAFSFNFPKFAEVVSAGRVFISWFVISFIVKSTLCKFPFSISSFISLNEFMQLIFLHKFKSVPPPTPVPPTWLKFVPSAFTNAVPVPMLTTKPLSLLDRYRPPLPIAWNSSTFIVGIS